MILEADPRPEPDPTAEPHQNGGCPIQVLVVLDEELRRHTESRSANTDQAAGTIIAKRALDTLQLTLSKRDMALHAALLLFIVFAGLVATAAVIGPSAALLAPLVSVVPSVLRNRNRRRSTDDVS